MRIPSRDAWQHHTPGVGWRDRRQRLGGSHRVLLPGLWPPGR